MKDLKHFISVIAIIFLASCGGGSGSSNPVNPTPAPTPAPTPPPTPISEQAHLLEANLEGEITKIIQMEGLSETKNGGGTPSSQKRTIYGNTADENFNTHQVQDDFEWPYVILSLDNIDDLEIPESLDRTIFSLGQNNILLINNRPAYQFQREISDTSFTGLTQGPKWGLFDETGTFFTPSDIDIYASTSSINEGGTFSVTMFTVNYDNGSTIPYSITGIDSNDLESGVLTGEFTISDSQSSKEFTITEDSITEGIESFKLKLDNYNLEIEVEINDTSQNPPETIHVLNVILEGQSKDILQIEGLQKIENPGGMPSDLIRTLYGNKADDGYSTHQINDGQDWPHIIVSVNDIADLNIPSSFDSSILSLGSDNILLINGRPSYHYKNEDSESSYTGLGEPGEWGLFSNNGEFFLTGDIDVYSDRSSVNEGDNFSVSINSLNYDDGTEFTYSIEGVSSNDISGEPLSGKFIINGDTDSKTFTVSKDFKTEGTETFKLKLDNFDLFAEIEIVDTSVTPAHLIRFPGDEWEKADPSEFGLDQNFVDELINYAFKDNNVFATQSVLAIHKGKIIGERYATGYDETSYGLIASMGKVFMPMLAYTAKDRGLFTSIDQPMSDILNEWSGNYTNITIRDMLEFRSNLNTSNGPAYGACNFQDFYKNTNFDYLNCMLNTPYLGSNSKKRRYNNHDYQLLALGLERAYQKNLFAATKDTFFDNLNIEMDEASWPEFPTISKMGIGFQSMTMHEIARVGYLLLRKGLWDGDRLLQENDIFEFTQEASAIIENLDETMSQNAHNYFPETCSFSFEGWGKQFLAIYPGLDLIVVRFSQWNFPFPGLDPIDYLVSQTFPLNKADSRGKEFTPKTLYEDVMANHPDQLSIMSDGKGEIQSANEWYGKECGSVRLDDISSETDFY